VHVRFSGFLALYFIGGAGILDSVLPVPGKLLTLGAAALFVAGALLSPRAASPEGHLVLVGGGPTPSVVFTRTLALSGGRAAMVAVLPQTYPNDSIGDAAVEMWKQLGVREIVKVSLADPAAALAVLQKATLIWMPGGFQGLLMKTLAGTPIPDEIRKRLTEGATIGGASAGAAAMSSTMIADETTPEGVGIAGATTDVGLGLWPEAIVSPHFSERRRLNPLLAILRDHPGLLGVGIDEGTAVIVSDGELEVMGRGTVVIVTARRAASGRASSDSTTPTQSPVRTLKSGMRFRYQ
jgi:cyanophycinase